MQATSPSAAVITGASGFIGRRLRARLGDPAHALPMSAEDWPRRLSSAPLANAVVYHLAARVHRSGDQDEAAYRRDNVEKTVALAQAALDAGARALVFLSTAKVLGEESSSPLPTSAPYAPADAYGRSKRAAEERLLASCGGRLPLTIVRVPLVYGTGAAGNLARLRRLCDSPLPLPFGAVRNRRSWIHVDDLVELLARCGTDTSPPPILHAAHPEPVSTPELLRALRLALGRPARMIPVPPAALEVAAMLPGVREPMRRLTRSFELDCAATLGLYGWHPRVPLAQAAADLARGGA